MNKKSILSDSMCLQQTAEVKIRGWDNPGQTVTVEPSWTKAEKGGTVEVQSELRNVKWRSTKGVKVTNNQGIFTIETTPGSRVLFWPENKVQPKATVAPVNCRGEAYRFGLPE